MLLRLPPRAVFATAVLAFSIGPALRADEVEVDEDAPPQSHTLVNFGSRRAEPEVAPASDEGAKALKRMQLPPGLVASLWAAEPMLANPVAFNFDERGRLFLAETHRYGTSVLDIRNYMWMLEEDLACRTIQDRAALIENKFGAAGMKELSLEGELLRVIEDTDHDGVADRSSIYASGFHSALDGIASGVLARRGEVWFTNIPSLWKFTGREKAETRTELSRGYGVRFNYTGHDLHGLAWGPDGKIYFSCGDRGAAVPTKEGGVVDVPDTGAVFRCNPDGTQLELFASGLRNPQSLLFTENGDLFTGDNDSDQGDEERLVHLVEDGDSGWRVGYQHAPLGNAGPWNSEKMWTPRHAGQAAFLLPPICNIEDGPSGIAYYPGTGLDDSYSGAIFITHFKGSIARSGIYTYKVKPDGASYAIAEAAPFLTNSLPTDVKFGPDGRLYYSDWAEGWPKSHRGRIYAIADAQHRNDPLVKETQALIASDFTKKSAADLVGLLGHADWRVRLEAQYTLAERGHEGVMALSESITTEGASPRARLHATWGLGQLARSSAEALEFLHTLILDRDPEVRAQAAKLLGDYHATDALRPLIVALHDSSARVRFFAAQSLGKLGQPEAAEPLLTLLRENDDADLYLRHAVVMGLVGANNAEALAAGAKSGLRAERMGVLLAWRRLGRPEIAEFLHDREPDLVREAALAINDAPVNAAWPQLAALIATPVTDEPVMLRAINANFRLGAPANADALAGYAVRADAPESLRAEALRQLAVWAKPPARDRIVGIFRPVAGPARDAGVPRAAVARLLRALTAADTPEAVQVAAISAAETLGVESAPAVFAAIVRDAKEPVSPRVAALNALAKSRDPQLAELVRFAGESDIAALRLAALPITATLSPEAAAPIIAHLVKEGNPDEQKTALTIAGTLKHPAADELMAGQLEELAKGEIAPSVRLELVEAAEKRTDPRVKKLLAEREARMAASGDPLAPFRVALQGGNARRGARTFYSHPVMACVRCHNAGQGGGDAGPNLAGVGARNPREYLLESVVKPNAKIAPGFDTVAVTTDSGDVIVGIVTGETAERVSLRNIADGQVVAVPKSSIRKREGVPSSMPEIYAAILTKAELRDVVEFLASLKSSGTGTPEAPGLRALRGIAKTP